MRVNLLQRENIKAVIDAVRAMGVAERDNFDTSDLFDARNPRQVWICILALGRAAYGISGYEGPCVGKVEKGKAKGGHGASTGGLWGKAGGAYNSADSGVAIASRQLE